jgi:hypothetical protein
VPPPLARAAKKAARFPISRVHHQLTAQPSQHSPIKRAICSALLPCVQTWAYTRRWAATPQHHA